MVAVSGIIVIVFLKFAYLLLTVRNLASTYSQTFGGDFKIEWLELTALFSQFALIGSSTHGSSLRLPQAMFVICNAMGALMIFSVCTDGLLDYCRLFCVCRSRS